MGNDMVVLILLLSIIGFVIFYFLSSSGTLGDGLKDIFGPTKTVVDTGAEGLTSAFNFLGIVAGNKKEGESCEKGKTACGDGLVCDAGICHKSTAKVGERCTAGVNQMTAVDYFPLVAAVSGGYAKKGGIECENGSQCVNNICYAEPTKIGDKCNKNDLKCPSGTTCYFTDGDWGTCYNDWPNEGEFCLSSGQDNKIKCRDGLTCWPRDNKGGKCYNNRDAKKGELCLAGGTAGLTAEIRCGSNLTCWPRDGTAGKCYSDPAAIGEPCIDTGNNKIKCAGNNSIQCSSKKPGHPPGTMGVCEKV
jgi:hypothetical protein